VKPANVGGIGGDDTIAAMSDRVSRRAVIVFGAALLTTSLAAVAQSGRVYTIGTLSMGTATQMDWWQPFLDALRDVGYVEGRNLVVKRSRAAGRPERLVGLAQELVQAKVDIIVTTGPRETRAARQATSTIPIVMMLVPDPVGLGLVSSLARPGGNVTGLTSLVPGMRQKWVELLKEAVPAASRFVAIASRNNLTAENLRELDTAATGLGVRLSGFPVQSIDDFEDTIVRARNERADGVIAIADPVTLQHSRAFVELMQKYRLPAIYWTREYVEDGGLMSYSANLVEVRRRAAGYVDKILKGARPAELPVEQPAKVELVINLKAAKALGLTLPPALLLRADATIE
jgi:putative tryptophan/tyrosine transport system substrate-binding protein